MSVTPSPYLSSNTHCGVTEVPCFATSGCIANDAGSCFSDLTYIAATQTRTDAQGVTTTVPVFAKDGSKKHVHVYYPGFDDPADPAYFNDCPPRTQYGHTLIPTLGVHGGHLVYNGAGVSQAFESPHNDGFQLYNADLPAPSSSSSSSSSSG